MVLNGSEQNGLAAGTRTRLATLGWGGVVIGTSPEPLRSSQILYPAARAAEAGCGGGGLVDVGGHGWRDGGG